MAETPKTPPLPWQQHKSVSDDPEALRRVEAIMEHANYIQADHDEAFLQRDEARGIRLELDYLKPQLLLECHGIEHTIVVFGSTRIYEAAEASRRLAELEASEPIMDAAAYAKAHRIARQRLAKSHYYDTARAFGRIVGNAGNGPEDNRVTLMTGGGPGIMEAANRGAFDVGAVSIGLNITLPHEQYPNPYITPELCFQFHYFAIRKLHFMHRARALVIFPGGFGTLDETFETLTLIQTRKVAPLPIVLVGESFWANIINFEALIEEGVIDERDVDLFVYAETAETIWETILQWHQVNGTPLFG